MIDDAGDTVLTAGIDAGVDTTDDIGILFPTDAGVEVTGTMAPNELGSNDATTAIPKTAKTFEAEVAISRAKYNYGNFASARQESHFSSPPALLMSTVQTGLFCLLLSFMPVRTCISVLRRTMPSHPVNLV